MATIYKIKANRVVSEEGGYVFIPVAWASSEGAARKAKKEMAERYGLQHLKDIEYGAVEVPTSKAGLIDWLNWNVSKEVSR